MKVVFHPDYYQVYASDPASAAGRMEAIVETIQSDVEFIEPIPASEAEIKMVHDSEHIEDVHRQGLYPVAALAVGGAIQAASLGLEHPSFGLVRPPPGIMHLPDPRGGFVFLITWPLR